MSSDPSVTGGESLVKITRDKPFFYYPKRLETVIEVMEYLQGNCHVDGDRSLLTADFKSHDEPFDFVILEPHEIREVTTLIKVYEDNDRLMHQLAQNQTYIRNRMGTIFESFNSIKKV